MKISVKWEVVLPVLVLIIVIAIILIRIFMPVDCGCKLPYNVDNYCNNPIMPETGMEGDVSTDEYKLLSLHVVIRHGDRTPLHTIETRGVTTKSIRCYFDEKLLKNLPIIQDFTETMKRNKHVFETSESFKIFNFTTLYPDVMACSPGILTPYGAAQHLRNGLFFKNKYQKHNLFINQDFEKNIKIITTMYSRTFQSAIAFLYGFLPRFDLGKLSIEKADMATMCRSSSPMKCDCQAVQRMDNVFANSYEQTWLPHILQISEKEFYDKVSERFSFNPKLPKPKPTPVFDFLVTHHCHNQTLDDCLLTDLYNQVEEHGVRMARNGRYKKITSLKMAPFLNELSNRLSHIERMLNKKLADEDKIEDYNDTFSSPIFYLYSGHDSTIEPLANALGFGDGHWPKYASRIVIEQYTKKNNESGDKNNERFENKETYIRILYNGKPVTKLTSFCKLGRYPLCLLSNFKKFVDDLSKDYRKDCHAMLAKRQNELDPRERFH